MNARIPIPEKHSKDSSEPTLIFKDKNLLRVLANFRNSQPTAYQISHQCLEKTLLLKSLGKENRSRMDTRESGKNGFHSGLLQQEKEASV